MSDEGGSLGGGVAGPGVGDELEEEEGGGDGAMMDAWLEYKNVECRRR